MTTDRELLEMALDALSDFNYGKRMIAIAALRARLAEPKSEQDETPVAWMFQNEETKRMNYVSNDGYDAPGKFLKMNPRYSLVCALYTHPQREWQGLTDEEIFEIWMKSPAETEDRFAFVHKVIAKLKEKNT